MFVNTAAKISVCLQTFEMNNLRVPIPGVGGAFIQSKQEGKVRQDFIICNIVNSHAELQIFFYSFTLKIHLCHIRWI